MKMTQIQESDIKSFKYKGDDSMIFEKDAKGHLIITTGANGHPRIPSVHPKFTASLRLKSGKVVVAPLAWRKKIWVWWYVQRRAELLAQADNVLRQVAMDMLSPNYPGGRYPESGSLNRGQG
jgi:hypothetical protein